MRMTVHLLGSLCSLSLAGAAMAQTDSLNRRWGFIGGITSATVGGSDVASSSRITRETAGALLVFQVTPRFALQTELTYTMKGARDPDNASTLYMNYLEVPLLARFDLGAGKARPFFYGGPAIAYNSDCHLVVTDPAAPGTYSCASIEELGGPKFTTIDYTVIAGGGVALHYWRPIVSFSARYDHSLKGIADDANTAHRVLSFVTSVEFPLGNFRSPGYIGKRPEH
jgi:hypothetical protein